ncbi:hypothetical protein LUZ60_005867 [Juncus effusus]|nr:hypothetical protein LUZ60_005867 [Juncus effusus]
MLSSCESFRTLFPSNPTNFISPKSPNQPNFPNPISKFEFKIPERSFCSKQTSYGGVMPLILESVQRVQDLDKAFEPWKKKLNLKGRTVILKEQTDWRRALEIFQWFKNDGFCGVNLIHYNIMLRILGKSRRLDLLVSLFLDMQIENVIPDNSTYTTLMDAYSKLGANKVVLIFLGDMYKRGISPDEMCIVTVVKAYKAIGQFEEGERVFNKWVMSKKTKPKTLNPLYTYNMMIDNYGKSGQFEKALNAFNEMISKGISPDAITFNTIISTLSKTGKFPEISKFVTLLIKLNILPDSKSHDWILLLCLKAGQVILAENYFYNIKGRSLYLDILGYRKLLYAYSKYKMVRKAETLIREIESKGIVLDEYTQSDISRMYINSNLMKKAWNWFEKWANTNSLSSNCFTANINAFGEKGYLSLAEKAFGLCIKMKKLSISTFNVMIKAYGTAKEYEKACELVDNMEKYEILPDNLTYNSLLIILSSAKLFEKASVYAKKMLNSNLILSKFSYSILIGAFTKTGELELIEKLFDEMSKSNMEIDIVTYAMLIEAYCEIGNIQMATKYLNLMKNAGFEVNFQICNSLIKLYAKNGNLLEALEIYRILKSLTGKVDSYSSNCMIRLYSENLMVKEAQEVFDELKLSGNANEFSYVTLLLSYRRLGRYKEAFRVSREMQKLGFLNEIFSYNAVIGLYLSDKRFKGAIKVFSRMLENNVSPNEVTFRVLRGVLVNCGVSKLDIRRIEKITKKNYKKGLYEWVRVVNSVFRLSEGVLANSLNLRGQNRKEFFIVKKTKSVVVCKKETLISKELLYA